jgi:hypothetical protein
MTDSTHWSIGRSSKLLQVFSSKVNPSSGPVKIYDNISLSRTFSHFYIGSLLRLEVGIRLLLLTPPLIVLTQKSTHSLICPLPDTHTLQLLNSHGMTTDDRMVSTVDIENTDSSNASAVACIYIFLREMAYKAVA